MRYDYIDLFIPVVKTYGFVFMVDDEPVLFIVNGKEILDGIPIYNDFDEDFEDEEFDEEYEDDEDIYTLLDENETILVGVEILDDDFNEKSVKDINDDNYEEFIYNLLPLKLHTIDYSKISMSDMMGTDKFKKMLLGVMNKYKKVLKKSKF